MTGSLRLLLLATILLGANRDGFIQVRIGHAESAPALTDLGPAVAPAAAPAQVAPAPEDQGQVAPTPAAADPANVSAEPAAYAANAVPPGFPANLRWSLVPKFIDWLAPKGTSIHWPPNDGCAAPAEARSLEPGELIDRFGSESGTFFSPKGESYAARAVPYVCTEMDYRVYRVLQPISVKACRAAPWFDEPGGAIQMQTDDPAYKLVANGMIEVVSYASGRSGSAAPQCGSP